MPHSGNWNLFSLIPVVVVVLVVLAGLVATRCLKRCPSDRVLVVFGRGTGRKRFKCVHGGTAFVVPILQDYAWLSLTPVVLDVAIADAVTRDHIGVTVRSSFTVGVSTNPALLDKAAERLLRLTDVEVAEEAARRAADPLRRTVSTLTHAQITRNPRGFEAQITEQVDKVLKPIGLVLHSLSIDEVVADLSANINSESTDSHTPA